MSNAFPTLTTEIDREAGPKAVFFGTNTDIIDPLGLYLVRHNTELYSAKTLDDAFYGDYFFYVGDGKDVKDFLAEKGRKLPKTLLVLTEVSELQVLTQVISQLFQVKLITLNPQTKLTPDQVTQVIDFFLGGSEQTKIDYHDTSLSLEPAVNLISNEAYYRERENNILKQLVDDRGAKPTSGSKKKGRKLFVTSLLILLLVIILPTGFMLGSAFLLVFHSQKMDEAIKKGELEKGSTHAEKIISYSKLLDNEWQTLSPLLTIFGQRKISEGGHDLFLTFSHLGRGAKYALASSKEGQKLTQGILGVAKDANATSQISAIKGNLALSDQELSLSEAELKNGRVLELWQVPILNTILPDISKLQEKIISSRTDINTLKQLMTLMPELIGLYGERSFLVIFQNNMELRPTGGFIGSFALVKFADGALQDFTVYDVYAADGALQGHVEPPAPLKKYLEAEHWYLRDSNWDPDFSKSAPRIAWFLEKELDMQVDGVIGTDLTMLEYLLELTGPVELPDYQETITSNNVFVKAQTHIKNNFFPGSSGKKDFLGSLSQAILNHILASNKISSGLAFQKFETALFEKHLQFFFVRSQAQDLVQDFGWAGAPKAVKCVFPCQDDYAHVVEANLGVNKANYFVKREISDLVNLTDEEETHVFSIIYKNTSQPEDTLGGAYRNYVRLLVPTEYDLVRANVAEAELTLSTGDVASSSGTVVGAAGDFKAFHAYLEIAPQESKTLTFEYRRPLIAGMTSFKYTVAKQAGTIADNLKINISYPISWQVKEQNNHNQDVAGATALAKGGQITYNTTLATDQKIILEIRK